MRIIVSVLLLLLGSFATAAQTGRIGVSLAVSGNSSVRTEIESSLKRELRALNDIDVYSSNPQFEIQVVVANPSAVIAISFVVLERRNFATYLNANLANKNLDPKVKEFITTSLAEKKTVSLHALHTDSPAYLDALCKGVVAKIDTDVFESERKFNSLLDQYRTPPAEKPRTTSKPLSTGESPFQSEYVGGEITLIKVKNDTDRLLTLNFGGVKYTLAAGTEREIEVGGGRYEYDASVPRAYPVSGVKEFPKGYRFSWRFWIVRR